jgi:hypothetical protein
MCHRLRCNPDIARIQPHTQREAEGNVTCARAGEAPKPGGAADQPATPTLCWLLILGLRSAENPGVSDWIYRTLVRMMVSITRSSTARLDPAKSSDPLRSVARNVT